MATEFVWVGIAASIGFIGTIVHLIRKRKLREQYSLLWLLLGIGMLGISLFPNLLETASNLLDVAYAPSLLYFTGLMGVLFILLHLTIAISTLTHKLISITQAAALRQEQVKRLERRIEELENGEARTVLAKKEIR